MLPRPCCTEATGCIAAALARLLRVVHGGEHLPPETTDDMQACPAPGICTHGKTHEGHCNVAFHMIVAMSMRGCDEHTGVVCNFTLTQSTCPECVVGYQINLN